MPATRKPTKPTPRRGPRCSLQRLPGGVRTHVQIKAPRNEASLAFTVHGIGYHRLHRDLMDHLRRSGRTVTVRGQVLPPLPRKRN